MSYDRRYCLRTNLSKMFTITRDELAIQMNKHQGPHHFRYFKSRSGIMKKGRTANVRSIHGPYTGITIQEELITRCIPA